MTGVSLREVTADDLEIHYQQQADREATEMAAIPGRSREDYMAHAARVLADPSNIYLTIVADGQVAGKVMSFTQDGEREVGYLLGKAYWGRGIATQALRLLLERLPERPLYGTVARHNPASRRVLEKCGFTLDREEIGDDGVPLSIMVLR